MSLDHVYWNPDPLTKQLHDAADECLGNIDGGEECRSSDTRWSRYHDLFRTAALVIEKRQQEAKKP